MRYVFRLETVLRVRRAEARTACAALHRANEALVTAIEARDAAAERYQQSGSRVTDADSLLRERCDAEIAADLLERSQRQVSRAAGEAALAHVAWSSAARRVAVLERLDERRRADHLEAEGRREVAMVDDIAAARHAMAVSS